MSKIREKDIERFTCGDCYVLAKEISALTGWPMYGFSNGDGFVLHVFCKMPNGRLIDIQGAHKPKVFRARWLGHFSSFRMCRTTWPKIRREWGKPSYGPYSYRRAKQLAPVVVAKYEGSVGTLPPLYPLDPNV